MRTLTTYLLFTLFFLPTLIGAQDISFDGSVQDTEAITEIHASHIYRVKISYGAESTVRIEASEEIKPYMEVSLHNGKLKLGMDQRVNFGKRGLRDAEIDVYVTLANLEVLRTSGASRVDANDIRSSDRLEIDMSGASRVDISGQAPSLRLELSGAANLDGDDLIVQRLHAQVSGAARGDITAKESITARVSGAGNLRYKGSPRERDIDTSGAGSVRGGR